MSAVSRFKAFYDFLINYVRYVIINEWNSFLGMLVFL
jgi:hypothetical protein